MPKITRWSRALACEKVSARTPASLSFFSKYFYHRFLSVPSKEERTLVSILHACSHRARKYNYLLSNTVLLPFHWWRSPGPLITLSKPARFVTTAPVAILSFLASKFRIYASLQYRFQPLTMWFRYLFMNLKIIQPQYRLELIRFTYS